MGMGKAPLTGRFQAGVYTSDPAKVIPPNWVQHYPMFSSKKGNIDGDAVRKEYKAILEKWINENPKGTVTEFRKKFGIVIDEQGRELLTADWKGDVQRFKREKQQRPSGVKALEPRITPKKPFYGKFVALEGHHVKGLAQLGVFFDGTTDAEAFSMRQAMLNEGFVGGTDVRNWAWLTRKQHDIAHKFLGYISDEELADPKYKGFTAADIDAPGKKGVSNFSTDIEKMIRALPATKGKRNWKSQSVYSGKKINPRTLTRQDLLLDYLRTIDEPAKNAITQSRKFAPYTIPWAQANPEAADLINKGQGLQLELNTAKKNIRNFIGSNPILSKTRSADLALQTAMHASGGNVLGAMMSGGMLTAQQAMNNPQVQKRIAAASAQLIAQRGAKSAAKLIPGLDILISGGETWDYLRRGRFDQAGIAALSGAVGWVPIIGDAAAAGLDITNTVKDIQRGDFRGAGTDGDPRNKYVNLDEIDQFDPNIHVPVQPKSRIRSFTGALGAYK
tara:strand:- start:334 stop:1842 length:1509 start_codon:yes stop_codon:yes gene_type:complete